MGDFFARTPQGFHVHFTFAHEIFAVFQLIYIYSIHQKLYHAIYFPGRKTSFRTNDEHRCSSLSTTSPASAM